MTIACFIALLRTTKLASIAHLLQLTTTRRSKPRQRNWYRPAPRREIPYELVPFVAEKQPSSIPSGGANQFAGGSCTRRSPAPFPAHVFASWLFSFIACDLVSNPVW